MRFNLAILALLVCQTASSAQSHQTITYPKTQFRGVWMATVRNLDWPSRPSLSNRKLKKEYCNQLDLLQSLGMNAVIVQIRPSGDAFYPSELVPWSEFLSGEQGKPPAGSFDPLNFMIVETHKRSMEFHAWFNPYRGIRNFSEAKLSPDHVYYRYPEWFVVYGKDAFFDPGMVPARKYIEKVIAEVVSRYDIDAVHFDDYYYPYRLEGVEFPDTLSFALYGEGYTPENKGDWRRENINLLVKELHDTINHLKPWVHFGISPFGVWRNRSKDPLGSDTETLQTNYDDLYGDALAWLRNGWLDYIIPQSYQYLGRDIMDYRVVARWWGKHNYGTNYYIGQSPYRLGDINRGEPWVKGNEIVRQLYFNDSIPGLKGSAYFRSTTFMQNPLGLNDSIRKFYRFPAIPPASHHDQDRGCEVEIVQLEHKLKKNSITINWQVNTPDMVNYYIIYRDDQTINSQNIVAITTDDRINLRLKNMKIHPGKLYISVVDRYRIEGEKQQVLH